MYKLTSQSIHGSSFGINLSFNDHISIDINDSNGRNVDYYAGGISTVITHAMSLFLRTFEKYFDTFPDGGLDIKKLWNELYNEYVKEAKKVLFRKAEGSQGWELSLSLEIVPNSLIAQPQ